MKIYRDGKEYELTFIEMMNAYDEYRLDSMIEDIDGLVGSGEKGVKLSDAQIKEVAAMAIHNLGKNDSYFEAYWASVECTLDEYIKNLPAEEDND